MAAGLISQSVLGDIANAIREQNGTSTKYTPSEMAAAVKALDGTKAGTATTLPLGSGTGVIGTPVLSSIADAIRAQNGSTTTYKPADMAAAIRALSWKPNVTPRALLLSDGTLELNCLEALQSKYGGTISQSYEISTAGYAKAADCPWDGIRAQVAKIWIDSSFASAVKDLGLTNFDHFFRSMTSLTEVTGFQYLSGMVSGNYCFYGCQKLETIWATAFDGSKMVAGTQMFGSDYKLVGGTDFTAASFVSHYSLCKLGAGGLLTDPANDKRQWFWGTVYSDNALEISAASTTDSTRTVLSHGRACVCAQYASQQALPWYANASKITSAKILDNMAKAGFAITRMNYWFYDCSNIASFGGFGNMPNLVSLRYTFSGCTGVNVFVLSGLDPSKLTDLYYAFSGCSNLAYIYVSSDWKLPSNSTGFQCFNGCKGLMGGNGTKWSSDHTAADYMRIDKDGEPGYLSEF
jgi:hypothetical protein